MKAILNFLKNWTLPSAIVGGTAIYFFFSLIPAFDSFSRAASPVFDAIMPWFLFVILFVTFLRIDFRNLRLRLWHLWVSISQIFMVLILMGCVLYFKVDGDDLILIECLLACIIGPCAASASVVTVKLGGDLESMTTYTFVSNVLSAVMIPLVFPLIDSHVDIAFGTAFLTIMWKVCVILVLPMGLAYVVKRFLPRLQHALVSVPDLSFYLWGCSLSIITGITFRNIMNANTSIGFLCTIAVVTFALCVIQFAVGQHIGRFFAAPPGVQSKDCSIVCGQSLGQKNTAFAIWVTSAYLAPLSAVGPGCYIMWQNAVNSLELWQRRKHPQH